MILVCVQNTNAQTLPPGFNENMAKKELEKRGLSEEDVRQKMKTKGFDVDNIDPNRLPQFQKALEETIAELEAAKTAPVPAAQTNEPKESPTIQETLGTQAEQISDEIIEKVEEGTPLEEAINEELLDVPAGLPSATIFGQHIFRNRTIKIYRQADDIKAPDNYVLGSGDELVVSIWGASVLEETHTISSSGYIKPSNLPRIYLKGIAFGKAKELIKRRYGLAYSFGDGSFEVGIKYSRTISVNITGEVINPGSYSLPAINTAFNALMASDGPNDIGSIRNIKLIRPGSPQQRIDIYEYLFNPASSDKFYLQDGDFIFVPVAEKVVSISGAIKRPFRYELLESENLMKLIEYAGGLKDNTYKETIQIKRFVEDEEVIIDVRLNDLIQAGGDYALSSGDRIELKTIPTSVQNFATISGAVDLPGEYEIFPAMRLSDIIDKGVLSLGAREDIAYLIKTSPDSKVTYQKIDLAQILSDNNSPENRIIEPKDRILLLRQSQFVDVRKVKIDGAVRASGEYNYTEDGGMRISDLINISGGLQLNAADFGFLYRQNESDGSLEYLRVDLTSLIQNESSAENLILKPNDLLRILNKEYFSDQGSINISGAVRNPGEYKYDPSLNLFDLLTLAGGLKLDATEFAYLYRSDPTKEKIREYIKLNISDFDINNNVIENVPLFPGDVINVFSKGYYLDNANIKISGLVRNPGQYEYDPSLSLTDLLTLSGGIKMEGATNRIEISRLIIENNQPTQTIVANVEVNDQFEIISGKEITLEPYDQIFVRAVPGFEFQKNIQIRGEVLYPGEYPIITDDEKIGSVITRAGGLTPEAFPPGATLLRSEDGIGYIVTRLDEVLRNRNSKFNMTLKAGDIIEIPKTKDIVSLQGAINAREIYSERLINEGKVNIAFHGKRSAKWYVNEYAGGFEENASKKSIYVEHPNGEIQTTKDFLFFKSYPKVRPGSVVSVGVKSPKEQKGDKPQQTNEKIDWGQVVSESLAQVTAVLTLIVLLQRVN